MKLRTFFLLSTAAFAAFALSTIGVLVVAASSTRRAASHMSEAINSVHAAAELQGNLLAHNREAFLASITEDPEHHELRESAESAVRHWTRAIGLYVQTPAEAELVASSERAVAAYLSERAELESRELPPLEVYRDATTALDEAYGLVDRLVDLNLAEARAFQADVERQERFATAFGIGAAGLLLIAITALIGGLRFLIYQPLFRLRERIARYGAGDSEARVPVRGPAEVRQIARVFNDMAETLARQREAQLRFVAAVAHELRNPLSTIKVSADLLAPSLHIPDEKRAEVVAAVRRQVLHLDRLVGDLLDTARIEAGHLELKTERCDLRDLAKEVATLYGGLSEVHRIVLDLPQAPVPCACDPVRVTQVLNNFVNNAIKYSPHGGTVRIRVERRAAEAILAVEDDGMGIASDDLSRIFEPFRRTGATRETIPGVGLGLSVARRIVEAHGGRIEVDSEPGKGSVFRMRLPAVD